MLRLHEPDLLLPREMGCHRFPGGSLQFAFTVFSYVLFFFLTFIYLLSGRVSARNMLIFIFRDAL